MSAPQLYRQLQLQLRQWIKPKDQRHLAVFSEIIAGILQSQSACLSQWLPYLSHRRCAARSHLERLHYFVYNPQISAETFYAPLLKVFLQAWEAQELILTLDTSMLWDTYCLIEVCLVWGGRSLALGQTVLEHGSASVAFEDYRPVLESTQALLPPNCTVTLLADRGFEHGEFIRWLNRTGWNWLIRAKSDLKVTLATGKVRQVSRLIPEPQSAHLYSEIQVLGDIQANLATANLAIAKDAWAVLTNLPPSLQTFALYGQRFGGIEPHFKDYKSAGFDLNRSRLRDAQALSCLLWLLAVAQLIALSVAIVSRALGLHRALDSHSQRGLSFLQLGLRQIQRLCYLGHWIPLLQPLPNHSPPPACASHKKRLALSDQILFSRVVSFSANPS
jgi:hypothetical protein